MQMEASVWTSYRTNGVLPLADSPPPPVSRGWVVPLAGRSGSIVSPLRAGARVPRCNSSLTGTKMKPSCRNLVTVPKNAMRLSCSVKLSTVSSCSTVVCSMSQPKQSTSTAFSNKINRACCMQYHMWHAASTQIINLTTI
jgi:hypothetical protein